MTITLDDLYSSPDHYLHSFEGETAIFVPMDRDAYHRSIFLDARISTVTAASLAIPTAALVDPGRQVASVGWIMHVAHCGSTLLARALDRRSANLVLREPQALRQLAFAPVDARLPLTRAMLSKRYHADLPTIVKGNVPINFLLPALTRFDPGARMIFLYLELRDYLLAILRSDNHRLWLRNVTTGLAVHIGDMPLASDAQRGAALWLAQIGRYAAAVPLLHNARSLNAEVFFAQPRLVVEAAARHLHTPMSEVEAIDIVDGPLFSTYSKNPALSFDNNERLARRRDAEVRLERELEEAERWIGDRREDVAAQMATLGDVSLIR